MASSNGLCRYGARIDCCWGWTRRSWGHCQRESCYCSAGWVFLGLPLLHYLNECGLKPRPCKHRCMNTYGSYKCYCLNGYMLLPDGSCGNARTCGMANCQYGCEVMKGEVRCQCPSPGLQLGPDGRTCVDVDECAAGQGVCPRFRKCVNTFGSYICKCHDGFELQYINGKYQCTDVDECATGQHQCFRSSVCYNTPGSYKCKCKDGFRGIGYDCKPIPKVSIDPPRPGKNPPNNKIPDYNDKKPPITVRPPATPKSITTSIPSTTKKRVIPTPKPPIVTVRPAVPTQKPVVPVTPTQPAPTPKSTTVDNSIQKEVTSKPRGDVHIPRNQGQNNVLGFDYDIELGNTAEEAHDDPDAGFLSCTFDDGICSWISDKEGDQHWETTEDPSGGKYLTIPEVWGRRSGRGARLVVPLVAPWDAGDLCLSFRHKLSGHHVGVLQVFLRKAQQHSPAVWGRTGGHGWRHTQITLWGVGLESVILKGERGRNRSGEIALDDISLRRGACTEEHSPRRL
uniref:Nephronectin a n=1 Tax=Paramormyrops kingsleyae TaxID=1676925 RepID=A0A3B3SNJ5_9TELE